MDNNKWFVVKSSFFKNKFESINEVCVFLKCTEILVWDFLF